MRNLVLLAVFAAGQAIWPIGNLPKGAGHTCGEFSCDEPAIQEEKLVPEKCQYCLDGQCFEAACGPGHNKRAKVMTCADKTRILLTAENGKKWCHAPQVNN